VIASCQAEVEKAAAGGREIPSKHIQREAERESCREEGQCPSTQILDSDLCRVRLLMVSGWQAAGPEEDDVAAVVAFPVSKDPRPLAQLAGTSIAMPAANGHGSSIIHRSAPGPFHREVAKLGRHYSMRAAMLRSYCCRLGNILSTPSVPIKLDV